MKKIRTAIVLLMTVLFILACKNQNDAPKLPEENNIADSEMEQNLKKIKLVPDYDWQAPTKDENTFKGYLAVESFLSSDYNRTVNIGDILTFHIKGKVSTNIKTKDGKDNRYLTVQLISSDWKLLGDPRPLRFDENGNIDETVKYKFFVNDYQINNPEKCKLFFNCDMEVVYDPEGFIELEIESIEYKDDQIERVSKIEATEEYTLTFEENFDGTDLNPLKWRRRAQLQHSNMKEPWNWADECSYVENGNLVIECRKNPVTGRYEAGGVETDGLFEQCGGKYEIRFKIDDGQGWWYAFWLMNMTEMNVNKSATDGCEIDILELIPHEKYIQTSFNWDGYPEDLLIKQAYYERWNFDENFFNDWHTATYYWMEDGYKLVMDGDEDSALVIPASKTGGVNHSANFIFITSEYGDWYGTLWDKNPKIKDEMLPARMLVDYVKVWKGGNEPIEQKPIEPKSTTYTLKPDYKWDETTNAPSTTEYDYYGIRVDLTEKYDKLPVAGETVSVNYTFVSDKNLSDLNFFIVDTSSAADYWLKLDGGYETEGHIQNITAGTEFTLSYNPTLAISPKSNITLWIYYPKTVFDEEISFTVKN
ncbi:MAG: family 16 glycosylhydrolase [Treponema sp.]|nr:family 16 glycosylhydrolase [Treponema sp.]